MDKDGDFMVDSVSMYHGQSLQVWKVKPMQKCFKPALFLIASWGQLHLLQKDVRFYLSLWENDPNFDPTATPYSQNKINTSNSKKTKMVTPNSRLQNDSPQTNGWGPAGFLRHFIQSLVSAVEQISIWLCGGSSRVVAQSDS